jgi:hypothetical protein
VLGTGLVLLLAFGARSTSAFEGPFCENISKVEGAACESQERTSIRRAIGHTTDAYSNIAIEAGGERQGGNCRTIECEANTGYLEKDGTGTAAIENAGPNGTRKVFGYLYP